MTSFTAGERRAVSIVQSASFSVGGSMKRQLSKLSGESENGVGQQRRPIHTIKRCGEAVPAECHLSRSVLCMLGEVRALRASSAGSIKARVTSPSRSFTLSSCSAPHARPQCGRDASISGTPNGIES